MTAALHRKLSTWVCSEDIVVLLLSVSFGSMQKEHSPS